MSFPHGYEHYLCWLASAMLQTCVEIGTRMFLCYITALLIHYLATLSCYIMSGILVLQHATILFSIL